MFEVPKENNKHPNFEWRGYRREAGSFVLRSYPICLNNFDADCSSAQVTFNPVLHEKDQPQAAIFCIAGSQTRYFPFKVRRTRLIKNKPQGIYWPPAQGVSSWEEENRRSFFIFLIRAPRSFSRARFALELADVLEKNEKKKKKRLCTGYFLYRD